MRETGRTYRDPLTERAVRAEEPLLHEVQGPGPRAYDVAVPIFVLNERRAVARVGISLERELAVIRRTRNLILGLGVLTLLAGLVLVSRQARSVTRPVAELVRGARELALGNLDHRISVASGDELGQLALAFNRMTESIQALIETSRELSSALDPDVVLRSIATHALRLVKADLAFIAPFDRDTREARVRVALGARTGRLESLVVTLGHGIGGRVLATGEPFVTDNYLRDPSIPHDPLYDELVEAEGIVAALAVPILLKGQSVGVLWVANRSAGTFSRAEVDSLSRMAQQAAIAMENAGLYQDLRRAHEEVLAAQAEVVQKTRMAAMGEIAAAVAHETRNPLGALSNCVQMLRMNPHVTGEDAELLDIMQAETERLNKIVSDFLAFGRPRPPQFQEVDLHEVIDETLAMLQRDQQCSPSIVFLRAFESRLPRIRGDRDQLREVFWNLFLNAVQAMGAQGTLGVETRRPDSRVEVRVRDTGPGVSSAALPRLFEPFFTTKPGGTGLGLPIVRRIVEEHGGRISLANPEGTGTCILVSLPVAPGREGS